MPKCTRKGFYNRPLNNKDSFRDDEEVFYCDITKEMFRDYEEYFHHIIAINSTVWKCELTDTGNLTYVEALTSEREARKESKDFKDVLKPPIMLVIEEAKQCSLSALNTLVFQFLRKRYFKNEEVLIVGKKISKNNMYKIVDILPSDNQTSSNGVYTEPKKLLYKLRNLNNKSPEAELIESFEKIRRSRYDVTLDKVQLFVKSHIIEENGIWKPKPAAYKKYVTDRKITFEDIFIGKMPKFTSAKLPKHVVLQNQEAILERIEHECTALLTKTDDLDRTDQRLLPTYAPVQMYIPAKFIGDAFILKEFFYHFSSIISNIEVFKERVTLYELSRALSIREVAGPLSDIILILLGTILDMQREEEDQCIVYYVKYIQKEEPKRTMSLASKTHHYVKRHFSFKLNQLPLDPLTLSEVVRLHLLSSGALVDNAKAERWRTMYRNGYTSSEDPGLEFRLKYPYILRALKMYTIYQLPFRDIMRILRCLIDQILTYSATINFIDERNEQMHNLRLGLKNAQIMESQRLAKVQSMKRSIINQFHQQCMTDEISKDIEKRTQLEAAHNKELTKLMTQSKKDQNKYEQQNEKFNDELCELLTYVGMDRAYRKYYVLHSIPGLFIEHVPDCMDCCLENVPKNNIIHNDLTAHNPNLPKNRKELRAYLLRMYNEKKQLAMAEKTEDENGKIRSNQSERENKENQLNGKLNGFAPNGIINHHDYNDKKLDTNEMQPQPSQRELFMCTGDGSNCVVHGDAQKSGQVRWSYIHKITDLEQLLASLNPLGIRESELRIQLTALKTSLEKHIKKCPVDILSVKPTDVNKFQRLMMTETHRKYKNTNYGLPIENADLNDVMYTALIERILEFERDIYTGDLGRLKVKDMEKWRQDLLNGCYDAQMKLQWGPPKQNNTTATITEEGNVTANSESGGKVQELQSEGGNINDAATCESDNDDDEETTSDDFGPYSMKPYVDPGNFLGETLEIDSEDSAEDEISLHESTTLKSNVRQLASATLQVEQAIERRFLKEPFGSSSILNDKEFNERNKQKAKNCLRQWEVSLMESTSYSQIFLHLNVLHDCIMWARSTNKSNCMICRKFHDPDKMLLCDECNGGTHMYCMKPIMKTVPEGNWYCKRCVTRLGLKNESNTQHKEMINRKMKSFIADEVASSDTSSVKSQLREHGRRYNSKRLQSTEIEHLLTEQFKDTDEQNNFHNEDECNDDNGNNCDEAYNPNDNDNNNKKDDDNADSGNMSNSNEAESICCICSYEGSELACTQCKNSYHLECINLKRPPRYNFICSNCKPTEISRKRKSKSYGFSSDSECNDEENFTAIKNKHARIERHSKRYTNNNNNSKNTNNNNNISNHENETGSSVNRRSHRRTGEKLPLNSSALYELLEKVMKNENAWPFLRPVSQAEVPDYYSIIKSPMDFAKVKSKLNMGSYQINEEVMRDIELIFKNCDEYNVKGNEIYQAGAALEKLVVGLCKELNLPFKASDMNDDD